MKKQREWTIKQLKENGFVSRNHALSLYFSRLGAVICDLNQSGWKIEGAKKGNDYVYTLVEAQKRPVYTFDLVDGVRKPRLTYVPV